MSTKPFGSFPIPGWIDYLLKVSKNGRFSINRYLSKRIISRYLKVTSRPFDIVVEDIKLRLYPRDNLHDRIIIREGKFRETDWFDDLFGGIPNDGVFIDIGANIGVFTLAAWTRLKPDLRIVAIEPHPIMNERLLTNLLLNNANTHIDAVSYAVGKENGSMTLHQPSPKNMGVTTLHSDGEKNSHVEYQISVKTLHSILVDAGVEKIDLLKIDIEGYEDRALIPFFESSSKNLWPKTIFIEHNSEDRWAVDIVSYMKNIGYSVVKKDYQNMLLSLN